MLNYFSYYLAILYKILQLCFQGNEENLSPSVVFLICF